MGGGGEGGGGIGLGSSRSRKRRPGDLAAVMADSSIMPTGAANGSLLGALPVRIEGRQFPQTGRAGVGSMGYTTHLELLDAARIALQSR